MKAILTILALIIFTLSSAQNWQAVNSNTTEDLNDIFFISETEGYMVSETGSIFRTDDAGDNWEGIYMQSNYSFKNITSINTNGEIELLAFGTNHEGQYIALTTYPNQSSATWEEQVISINPLNLIASIEDIFCYSYSGTLPTLYKWVDNDFVNVRTDIDLYGKNNNSLVYINTNYNEIYRSYDNGVNWEQLNNYPSNFGQNQSTYAVIKPFDNLIIIHYTYPNNTVYSLDNGDNWTYLPDGEYGVNYCEIINETTLFGAGLPETHLNVQHNFQPWVPNFVMPEKIRKIYFYNDHLGFVLGENGMVYKTTNMGGLLSTIELEELKKKITLYPNPAIDKLFIESPEPIVAYTIYDASGKLIQHVQTTINTIDVVSLPKGFYVLKTRTDKNVYSKSFLKK